MTNELCEGKTIKLDKIENYSFSDWNKKYDFTINEIGKIALDTFNSLKEKPKKIELILNEVDNNLVTNIEPEFYPVVALRNYFDKNFSNKKYELTSVGFTSIGNSSVKFEFGYKD